MGQMGQMGQMGPMGKTFRAPYCPIKLRPDNLWSPQNQSPPQKN